MIPILLSLYGFAGFLCFLGYLFALIDWYSRRSRLTWENRLAIGDVNVSHKSDVTGSIGTSSPEDKEAAQTEMHHIQLEAKSTQSRGDLMVTEDQEPLNETEDMILETNTAEKIRLHGQEDEPVEPAEDWGVQEKETNLDDRLDWTPIELEAESTFGHFPLISKTDEEADEDRDGSIRIRKFSVPEEIRAAHSQCSRRTSVQVTDLDDQLHAASVHMKEAPETAALA
ncbi:unnamed protein product [Echinostoma caproni]|uniref:Transmembrane protein n=1 Tax=Echinostoma caproni TaxID=27848 RepID=A0A183AKF6_9TREM|nr:unnamed protein product [Echinostoma caproni]